MKRVCLREEECGPFQKRVLREFISEEGNKSDLVNFLNDMCTYGFDPRNLAGNRDTTCGICLGEFKDRERIFCFPSCKHIFHSQCIYENMDRNKRCPFCRKNLPDALLHDISNNRVTDFTPVINEAEAGGTWNRLTRFMGF